jgi:predicted NAD-dependent protein-ADP-ribosyltransferase YbiA (DUF1768 family)
MPIIPAFQEAGGTGSRLSQAKIVVPGQVYLTVEHFLLMHKTMGSINSIAKKD